VPTPAPRGVVQPPLPKPALRPELRAARSIKPLIVLDPGHGGHDSGAQRNNTVEKEVVLAFAQVLKKQLEATGRYRILMTRDDDTFVPLHERREFAEKNRAALFIAIHADYASTNASGATIYSLRETVADSLARSAKGERSADLLTSGELAMTREIGDSGAVRSILSDLAVRETLVTRERTGTFVRSVIEYMKESTNLKDNPDRSAAFAVLKTAKVPAVLIELAYVTNSEDARNLRSDEWRKKVGTSMVTAIDNYFSHQVARLPM
jgi:N-acetylmuramoyl-L-alanine amidase